MVTILFHLTDFDPLYGLESPKNYINEWMQIAKAFGVDKIIMIDRTQFKLGKYYNHRSSDIGYEYYETLENSYDVHKDKNWVFFEDKETMESHNVQISSLTNFKHPENPIYVIGPNFGTYNKEPYYNDFWVYIEMVSPNPLYGTQAIPIVLYDRMMKENK